MMYAVYGLWAVALIIAIRLGLTLFYQWKYKDILPVNPRKQKQLLLKSATPLLVVMVFTFTLQSQVNNAQDFEIMKLRTLEPQRTDENFQGFLSTTSEEFSIEGKVVIDQEGVETSYFVVTIRGVKYLIEDPNE